MLKQIQTWYNLLEILRQHLYVYKKSDKVGHFLEVDHGVVNDIAKENAKYDIEC